MPDTLPGPNRHGPDMAAITILDTPARVPAVGTARELLRSSLSTNTRIAYRGH